MLNFKGCKFCITVDNGTTFTVTVILLLTEIPLETTMITIKTSAREYSQN